MMTATLSGPDLLASALAAYPAVLPILILLLKLTLVLLAALGVTQLLQRAPASSRHLVWLVALVGLLLLPALTRWAPLSLRVLPAATVTSDAPSDPGQRSTAPSTAFDPAVASPAGSAPSSLPTSSPSPGHAIDAGTTLGLIWAGVALLFLLRLAHGAWSVRRIERQARRLEHPDWQTPLYQIADRLGLEQAPTLLQSDLVKMPFAAGLLSPQIVLPSESEGWSAERRSAVLIHELGHVRRRDLIGHTLSRIVCAVYWFHPLVWVAARNLRAESERACDDLALVFGARPSEYAEHLLDIVTCVRDHNTPAVALAMAHRKEFEGRMLAILNPELRRRAPARAATLALAGSVGVMALLIGAAAPVPRLPAERLAMQQLDSIGTTARGDTARRVVAAPVAPRDAAPAAEPHPRPDPSPAAAPAPLPVLLAADSVAADERADVLARLLRTDANAEVRRVAAWGLERYAESDAGAVVALSTALSKDENDAVREMAAWALANAEGRHGAGAALLAALKREKHPEVRATLLWAVGASSEESATDVVTQSLGDDDAAVRELAAWALGNIHPAFAPPALLKLLTDRERYVRMSATWAIYTIQDPASLDAVKAAYDRETDEDIKYRLIWALGGFSEASVAVLDRLITTGDDKTREAVVNQLAKRGHGGPWPWPRPRPRPFP